MTINTIMQISPIQLPALSLFATSMVSAGPNIHARKQAKHDAMQDSGADFDRSVLDAMGEDEDWEDEDDYRVIFLKMS